MDNSLHIALCDSNPGDRKQMERLLGRESDRRINSTGVFYIDTFGSVEAILKAALVYDIYFLDSTDPLCDSYSIAQAIRAKGIQSPIVFCISTIDYRKSGELISNSVFLNKPIKVDELRLVIDEIIHQRIEDYIPTVELRNNYEAFYITEKEVSYFTGKGYNVEVHYRDGRIRPASTSIDRLIGDLSPFDSYYQIHKSAIVNINCVKEVNFMSVIMDDGSKLPASPIYTRYLKVD